MCVCVCVSLTSGLPRFCKTLQGKRAINTQFWHVGILDVVTVCLLSYLQEWAWWSGGPSRAPAPLRCTHTLWRRRSTAELRDWQTALCPNLCPTQPAETTQQSSQHHTHTSCNLSDTATLYCQKYWHPLLTNRFDYFSCCHRFGSAFFCSKEGGANTFGNIVYLVKRK